MPNEETMGTQTGVTDAARKVGEGLGELGRALSDGRQSVVEPVAEFIQERPLAALGIAFGIGYVFGGGLFSRATGRVIGLGWRLGGVALARNLFTSLSGAGQPMCGRGRWRRTRDPKIDGSARIAKGRWRRTKSGGWPARGSSIATRGRWAGWWPRTSGW